MAYLQIEDLQYGIGIWTTGVWRETINVDLYFIKALCPCGPMSGSDKGRVGLTRVIYFISFHPAMFNQGFHLL